MVRNKKNHMTPRVRVFTPRATMNLVVEVSFRHETMFLRDTRGSRTLPQSFKKSDCRRPNAGVDVVKGFFWLG